MLKFHPLTVTSLERAAEDAVCISLAVPAHLADDFAFHAGQYVTVRRTVGGREERRTYSIVTAPGGAIMKLGVRVQPNGRMSGELGGVLRAGEVLEVGTPTGRFRTQIDSARRQSYVAFAAGSGITPVLSLASDILAREPHSRFTLIYGNRSMSRTMFLEETLGLKNRYLGRFAVHFVMSREPQHSDVFNGRIDGAKVRELASYIDGIAAADEYFVCGPGSMVEELQGAIKEMNASARIRVERFATATATASSEASAGSAATASGSRSTTAASARGGEAAASAPEILATISVTMDGRRRTFPMAPNDPSVLDAAEREGLELPFSCRSGICATCRVRVLDGKVVMTHNIALARWEVDAGFVLCCQARPTTETLELSYDEK
jgi:ring-1,2-phenylacetyl-CoA epoxidase subunit PaaE